MNTALSIAGVALALTVCGAARPAPPAGGTGAGVWRIEPAHTRVLFSVTHLGFTTYSGEFVGASGALGLDPANLAASHLEVTVPITGISTPSAALDKELEGPDWFDAADFPIMTFRSTAIVRTGPDTADVVGDLSLHGVTRSVTFKARFNLAGMDLVDGADMAGFDVRGEIRRSDFGMTRLAPLIGDEVRLIISAAFERARRP